MFNLHAIGSNHSPIVVDTDYSDKKSLRRFRFEVGWISYDSCERIVQESWNMQYEGSKML